MKTCLFILNFLTLSLFSQDFKSDNELQLLLGNNFLFALVQPEELTREVKFEKIAFNGILPFGKNGGSLIRANVKLKNVFYSPILLNLEEGIDYQDVKFKDSSLSFWLHVENVGGALTYNNVFDSLDPKIVFAEKIKIADQQLFVIRRIISTENLENIKKVVAKRKEYDQLIIKDIGLDKIMKNR